MSVKSTTDDNGTCLRVSGNAVADGFRIVGDDGPFLASGHLLTSNALWDRRIVGEDRLIDVQHGGEIGLVTKKLGDEQVDTPQGPVRALLCQSRVRQLRGFPAAASRVRGAVGGGDGPGSRACPVHPGAARYYYIASAGGCRDAVRAGRRHMVMVHAGGTWNSGREEPDEPSGCRGRRFREQALARGRAGQQHVRPAGDPGEAPGLAIGHRDVRPAWRGCRRERVWARRPMPPRPRTTWSTPSPTVAAEQARARPSDGVQVIAGKG